MTEKTTDEPTRETDHSAPDEAERNPIKDRQTTHWDVDMLPRAEVEALYRAGRRRVWRKRLQHVALWTAIAAGVIAIAAAVAFAVVGWAA